MEASEVAVTDASPILWSRPRPFPFLCFLCGHDDAITRLTIRDGEMDVNVCLCNRCAELPVSEILAGVHRNKTA